MAADHIGQYGRRRGTGQMPERKRPEKDFRWVVPCERDKKWIEALSLAAYRAHPSWREAESEVVIYPDRTLMRIDASTWRELDCPAIKIAGRTFIKEKRTGAKTKDGVLQWFETNHPEQAQRIKEEIYGKEAA
jgi:hypothetical protein